MLIPPVSTGSRIYNTVHVTPENDGAWSTSFPSLCLTFHRGADTRLLHIQVSLYNGCCRYWPACYVVSVNYCTPPDQVFPKPFAPIFEPALQSA